MLASILAFFKAFAEFLSLGKWLYQETKKTQIQKEAEIDAQNSDQKEKAKKEGRPSWD